MLASVSLAAMLAIASLPSSAIATTHGSSASQPSDAQSVAVLPTVIDGELPKVWRGETNSRVNQGLSRGRLTVDRVDVTGCAAADCAATQAKQAGASYGVWSRLTSQPGARHYSFVIEAVSAGTSKVVATVEGACDLCGLEEAMAMVEAKAAALPPAIDRLSATIPVVVFTSIPVGVEVSIDDEIVGTTPLELPLTPGSHRVRGSMAGFQPQTFEVEAVEGVRKELTFSLVAAPTTPAAPAPVETPPSQTRRMVVAGAVLTSLGVAGAAAGGTLLALDGRSFRRACEADAQGDCRQLYGTVAAGSIPLALGSVAVGAGIALLIVGTKQRRTSRATQARVIPTGSGLRVRF